MPELLAGIATSPIYLLQTALLYASARCDTVNDEYLLDSLDALSKHYNAPSGSSQSKQHDYLTDAMQQWLQHSPFFVLCSSSVDGLDVSPRGDDADQAFRVLDASTIAIPDRRGNNRIETLSNIIQNPQVGLLFLIPGIDEALRIKGSARISVEPDLLASFELEGSQPATVMLISVSCAYVQNARAIRRAGLWNADSQKPAQTLPDAHALSGKPSHNL